MIEHNTDTYQELREINNSFAAASEEITHETQAFSNSLKIAKKAVDSLNPSVNEIMRAILPMKGELQGSKESMAELNKIVKRVAADLGQSIGRSIIGANSHNNEQSLLQGFGKMLNNMFSNMGRHTGGTVASKTPYVVGEKGPELFVPNGSGYIVPNGRSNTKQGVNLYVNINTSDASSFQRNQGQVISETIKALKRATRNI